MHARAVCRLIDNDEQQGNIMNRESVAFVLRMLGVGTMLPAMLAVSACSSMSKQESVDVSQVQVYRSMQLTPSRYTVVKRIWIDDWHSNVSYPSFDKEQAGIDAMKREAARVGANGIMHVICLDPGSGKSTGGLLCYGDAVKVN
jgi:hypothetical protein